MASVIDFVFIILNALLTIIVWTVIANALVSWLIAFDVINLRNRVAAQIVHMLDRVTRPLLWPFRKIIPPLGGIDITPLILILIITAAQATVIPRLHSWLVGLVPP